MPESTNADVVVRELLGHGVGTIFTVSGNQILPLIDAAGRAGVHLVHMRHETAAVYAAIAAAEVTGGISVALVSAGPGFLASLQGLGVAMSMELPILLLSGASPAGQRGLGAFQELDQRTIASAVCKGSVELSPHDPIGSVLDAWSMAVSDIPGPVHLSLPSDVLAAPDDRERPNLPDPATWRFDEEITRRLDEMAAALSKAERPLVIARPSIGRPSRDASLLGLTGALGIGPIVTESPRGLSDLKYSEIFARLRESDCLLTIGPADFSAGFLAEATIGNPRDVLLIDAPGDPTPRRADHLHVRAPTSQAVRYLAGRVIRHQPVADDWAALWPIPAPTPAPPQTWGPMHPLAVSEALRAVLQPEDVVILDGGEFCQWIRYGLRDLPNRLLWNGKLGAIGGSIPMAIGAATVAKAGRVYVLLGDGSAGYHLSEFETAAREHLRFTAIIGNDARWAAEWHMQIERYGPDSTFSTSLTAARYDLAAHGFGGVGVLVDEPNALRGALETALESPTATCINAIVAAERSPATVTH
ncbi:MAG TPA: thiamine pyrophosphate-binding protein [Thermomicrobiales bacterium]|nr:thiamine pyrophosphate-binding protein [Thermomicrobiales bacterium]